jgi:uncharacterized protein YccT (UPF0319 family)
MLLAGEVGGELAAQLQDSADYNQKAAAAAICTFVEVHPSIAQRTTAGTPQPSQHGAQSTSSWSSLVPAAEY